MSHTQSPRRCPQLSRLVRWVSAGLAPALILAAVGCQDQDATAPTAPTPGGELSLAQAAGFSFIQVSSGNSSTHSCGITSDNKAYCWGWNFYGQLGDGTTENRSRPVPVAGSLRFRQVTA